MKTNDPRIDGIAVDHYQFLHYKKYFPSQSYKIYMHTSAPVTVGVLFSEENDSWLGCVSSAFRQCLHQQAAFGMSTLENDIISFLNHSWKIPDQKLDKTADAIFDANFRRFIYIAASILVGLLVSFGILDHFLIRKIVFHKSGDCVGHEIDKIENWHQGSKRCENELEKL